MIQAPQHINLSQDALDDLQGWQKIIDDEATYALQIEKAKSTWGKSNSTMNEVKDRLREMSNNTFRCNYCEDSYSDEVEHIWPKDIYPDKTYVWRNYVFACGPCNGPKNNSFALINPVTTTLLDITPPHPRRRPAGYIPNRPPNYQAALIDPRKEDPLDFLTLDIVNTFYFISSSSNTPEKEIRANYTIDILRLNDREYLVEGRKQAYGNFRARIIEYEQAKQSGSNQVLLDNLKSNLLQANHITVWKEMKRFYQRVPDLNTLFTNNPELLNW